MKLINELTHSLMNHLKWHKSRITCAAQILQSLIINRTVGLPHLATGFKNKATPESNYRRIKRFFAFNFDLSSIIFIVLSLFDFPKGLELIMDRTNWKLGKANINILFISITYLGIGIPILWFTMDKGGNSNADERIGLLKKVISKIGKDRIKSFVADREFIGKKWLNFLYQQKIPFVIRVRNDAKLGGFLPANLLYRKLKNGKKLVANEKIMLWGLMLYISASRSLDGELMLLVSNYKFENPQAIYKKRWEIEVMFQCLKGRGFNLEATHITDPHKIDRLIFMLGIAFCWMYKIGEIKNCLKPIEIKKHGRKAKSLFRYGFDEIRRMLNDLRRYCKCLYKLISVLCNCRRERYE